MNKTNIADGVLKGHGGLDKEAPTHADAYLNRFRWVVDCPRCGAGQLANEVEKDGLQYCGQCHILVANRFMEQANIEPDTKNSIEIAKRMAVDLGEGYKIRYPREKDEIERLVAARPLVNGHPLRHNWNKGESLSQLEKENRDHGVSTLTKGQWQKAKGRVQGGK